MKSQLPTQGLPTSEMRIH